MALFEENNNVPPAENSTESTQPSVSPGTQSDPNTPQHDAAGQEQGATAAASAHDHSADQEHSETTASFGEHGIGEHTTGEHTGSEHGISEHATSAPTSSETPSQGNTPTFTDTNTATPETTAEETQHQSATSANINNEQPVDDFAA